MVHVTPEQLAGHALGQPDQLSADELHHLDGCDACRSELLQLRETAEAARRGVSHQPQMPSSSVWDRIAAEVAADTGSGSTRVAPPAPAADLPGRADRPPAPTSLTTIGPRRSRRSVSRPAIVLVAAALGLIVGVGGTIVVNLLGSRTEVVSTTTLEALPGHSGRGTAELLRSGETTELRVRVDAAAPTQDYRELWLINTDGKRMYSLGVLPDSGTGSYPLPAQLDEKLEGFTIVDVSIEPYDGDALHSRNSLVRGTLPT